VFCQIVAGEIPARVVHETDTTLSFLDANPLAPGHTLVVPKDHYERLEDLPAEVAEAVFGELHRVNAAAQSAAEAPASTVAFNNGSEAGQEVPHVHGHVIPRFADDGGRPIHAVTGTRPELSDGELDEIAAAIAANL